MDIEVEDGYRPGCIGRITELHAGFYHRTEGFGLVFESKVARELAEFCERYDPAFDGLWLAVVDDQTHGSIVIDGATSDGPGAHLRWYITSDATRGSGIGRKLLKTALEFCDAKRCPLVYLNTFAGLDTARHLYEAFGFELVEEAAGTQWGHKVIEQRFERAYSSGSNRP
jgi:GNAT superfamily N-acetyltransferase